MMRPGTPTRLLLGALLGILAAVLVACGSSGKGLIPLANAGPLQSDFEEIAQAAQTGNGNCAATTAAINKAERDFAALPTTVDAALRSRLSQGLSNLRERALALCAEPLAPSTTTSTTRTTTTHTQSTPAPAPTATTPTTTTHESTTPAPSPTPPTGNGSGNGGGTAAPGENPGGVEPGGGVSAGEAEGNGGGGAGQEGVAK